MYLGVVVSTALIVWALFGAFGLGVLGTLFVMV